MLKNSKVMLHNRSSDDLLVQLGVAPIQKQKLPEHTGGSEKCEKEFEEYKNRTHSSEDSVGKYKEFQVGKIDQLESSRNSRNRVHKTSLNSLVDQLRPDTE